MYVVFDLETTGFSSTVNDIIQFAYIMYDSNQIPVKAESLYFYYEGMSWSEEAYEVHQIPISFLIQHKDKFQENIIKMYAILMNANVCGHNMLQFDAPFAKNWLGRMGLPGLEYRCIQDTMTAFKPLTKRPRIKLIKLAEILGVTDELTRKMTERVFGDSMAKQAHNAAFDTMRTGIITNIGLRKNYISFSDNAHDDEVYTDEDLEVEEVKLDPLYLLFRIRCDGKVIPILQRATKVVKLWDPEAKNYVNTDQCLEGIFEPDYDSIEHSSCAGAEEVCYTFKLRINRTTLIYDGTNLYLELYPGAPITDFFSNPNRSTFVKNFNAKAERVDWRFEDV